MKINIPLNIIRAVSIAFVCNALIAAEQVDLTQAQQMCQNATPQQRQMAKAAGYDLDSLCQSLKSGVATQKTLEQPELVKQRKGKADEQKYLLQKEEEVPVHPLTLLTPEQIAAMTPEQIAKLLETVDNKIKAEKQGPLKPFGYELFAGEATTFAPATQIPIPVNYMVGPGDTVEIQLFGKTSQQLSLVVNRNGQIQFPELGPISVAGLSFNEMKQLLHTRVKEQMIGVEASISLGELRSIQVFLLGEAYAPGSYTVSSLSTITNALFVSGGINDIGSLRNIQLKRQGKVVAELDLYDLLLNGDTSDDVRLLPGDVVYIPPVGPTVGIDGAIKRRAIYELKNEKTVKQLIKMAGGLHSNAFNREAQLSRINDNGFTSVIQVDKPEESQQNLKDGDHLLIQERIQVSRGVVKLSGHVYRAKQMAWRQGLRVSDLVPSLNSLRLFPQLESALLVRLEQPVQSIEIEVVNLADALNFKQSNKDPLLQPEDELIVLGFNEEREDQLEALVEKLEKQATSLKSSLTVAISGMVRFPGKYPLAKNMTVKELIDLAGGYAESAYTLTGEVTRISLENPEKTEVKHFSVQLNSELAEHKAEQFVLTSRDVVNIRQRPEYREFAMVEVKGEVKFPGTYRVRKGESLKDLMKRVGGFTDFAHIEAIVFTREELKEREEKQLKELREKLKADIANAQLEQSNVGKTTNLSSLEQLSGSLESTRALGRLVVDVKAILGDMNEYIILKDGDEILVPAFRQEVGVVGEVQHPASHLYDPYLTFEEYIERSGGETDKADDEKVYIVKADGSVVLPYKSGWVNALGVQIEPGDTIVVPLDVDAVNELALWTQVSQIIYQLALGAAAITRL